MMKETTTSKNPKVTMATARPTSGIVLDTRNSRIGFSPIAMNSASPMITRTLVTSDIPRKEQVGHADTQRSREPDEERGCAGRGGRPRVPRDAPVSFSLRPPPGGE